MKKYHRHPSKTQLQAYHYPPAPTKSLKPSMVKEVIDFTPTLMSGCDSGQTTYRKDSLTHLSEQSSFQEQPKKLPKMRTQDNPQHHKSQYYIFHNQQQDQGLKRQASQPVKQKKHQNSKQKPYSFAQEVNKENLNQTEDDIFSSIQTFVDKQRTHQDNDQIKEQTEAFQYYLKHQIKKTQSNVHKEIESKLLTQNYLFQDQIKSLENKCSQLKYDYSQANQQMEAEKHERELSQQLTEKVMRESRELRSVLAMYEELLDKLSAQNKKLKSWIKTRKSKEEKQSKKHVQSQQHTQYFNQFPQNSHHQSQTQLLYQMPQMHPQMSQLADTKQIRSTSDLFTHTQRHLQPQNYTPQATTSTQLMQQMLPQNSNREFVPLRNYVEVPHNNFNYQQQEGTRSHSQLPTANILQPPQQHMQSQDLQMRQRPQSQINSAKHVFDQVPLQFRPPPPPQESKPRVNLSAAGNSTVQSEYSHASNRNKQRYDPYQGNGGAVSTYDDQKLRPSQLTNSGLQPGLSTFRLNPSTKNHNKTPQVDYTLRANILH